MAVSHRLSKPMHIRPDEGLNESPKRIVFISVEGNCTEKDYFNCVEKFREELKINSLVHIETLSRKRVDTCSDPESVYNLLMDYIKIRKEGILFKDIYSIIGNEKEKYSVDYIKRYINNELSRDEEKQLTSVIQLAGVDIDYQKFLYEFKGEDDNDVFAIIIDRDKGCHSEDVLKEIMKECHDNGCLFFMTNPCFEFWLWLHLEDVSNTKNFDTQKDSILENKKVSGKHTYVSKKVSDIAGHGKNITEAKFKKYYLNSIDTAIERADNFVQEDEELLKYLGSNIPKLFSVLREKI